MCGREITSQSVDQITDILLSEPEGTKLTVLAPVVRRRKGMHEKVISRIARDGFVRIRLDGEIVRIDDEGNEISLDKNVRHTIEIIIDRIKVRDGVRSRLSEACELAVEQSEGLVQVIVERPDDDASEEKIFSTSLACPEHGVSIEELEPRMFSFNNPMGACPECRGLGFIQQIDPALLIPEQDKSIDEKCLSNAFGTMEFTSFYWQVIKALCDKYDASIYEPFSELPEEFRNALLYGTGDEKLMYDYTNRSGFVQHRSHSYEGLIPNLERRYRETSSEWIKEKIEQFMSYDVCPECHGRRLREELLCVTVGGKNIMEFCDLSVSEAVEFLEELELDDVRRRISAEIIKEIRGRLSFLSNVGLGYLTLSRSAGTLSGGESQRIRLAIQIGSGLVGVLYILDEPTTGLHSADVERLVYMLDKLADAGNTVVVIEHNLDVVKRADHIIDLGPDGGSGGGMIVAEGTPEEIAEVEGSYTGKFLKRIFEKQGW